MAFPTMTHFHGILRHELQPKQVVVLIGLGEQRGLVMEEIKVLDKVVAEEMLEMLHMKKFGHTVEGNNLIHINLHQKFMGREQ